MAVTFDLPPDIEEDLTRALGDLASVAKEAALVELYRHHKITQHQFARALGLTRLEADGVLKRHNVTEDLLTVEEYEAQLAHLEAMKLP